MATITRSTKLSFGDRVTCWAGEGVITEKLASKYGYYVVVIDKPSAPRFEGKAVGAKLSEVQAVAS